MLGSGMNINSNMGAGNIGGLSGLSGLSGTGSSSDDISKIIAQLTGGSSSSIGTGSQAGGTGTKFSLTSLFGAGNLSSLFGSSTGSGISSQMGNSTGMNSQLGNSIGNFLG